MPEDTTTLVILEDGETYSLINGCSIVVIKTEALGKMVKEGSDPQNLKKEDIISRIALYGDF